MEKMTEYKGFKIFKIVVYEVRNSQYLGIDTLNTLKEAKERIKELKEVEKKDG